MSASKNNRSWKMERASVLQADKSRPRSNKYSASDSSRKPAPRHSRQIWVGGYKRADGSKVKGYYRATPHA